jgi:hypothetical protein
VQQAGIQRGAAGGGTAIESTEAEVMQKRGIEKIAAEAIRKTRTQRETVWTQFREQKQRL